MGGEGATQLVRRHKVKAVPCALLGLRIPIIGSFRGLMHNGARGVAEAAKFKKMGDRSFQFTAEVSKQHSFGDSVSSTNILCVLQEDGMLSRWIGKRRHGVWTPVVIEVHSLLYYNRQKIYRTNRIIRVEGHFLKETRDFLHRVEWGRGLL